MNKISVSLLACLLTGTFVQAQTLQETWNVFDVSAKSITEIKVDAVPKTEPEEPVIASVVAEDDREDITGSATGLEKAVVVLEMDLDGHKSLCSGSMVGARTVLTAAHCLNHAGHYMNSVRVYAVGLPPSRDNQKPSKPKDRVTPKTPTDDIIRVLPPKDKQKIPNLPEKIDSIIRRVGPGWPKLKNPAVLNSKVDAGVTAQTQAGDAPSLDDILRGLHNEGYPSAQAQTLWVPSQWIKYTQNNRGSSVNLEKEERYDYGIIVLDNPLGDKTGYLGMGVSSNSELRNASILVVGRGGDKPARSLWRSRGRVGDIHPHYFMHNADQVGGNSGGPIFNAYNTNKIIALANFGDGRQHVNGGYPNGGLRITHGIVNAVKKASK